MQDIPRDIAEEIEKYLIAEQFEPQKGHIVKCRIIEILDDIVLVDLGLKTEGKIKKSEIDERWLRNGKEVEAVFLGRGADGLYKLSYKAAKEMKMVEYLERLRRERKPVHGIVLGKTKSFYDVDVGDLSGLNVGEYIALCPVSHAADIKVGGHYEFAIRDRAENGKFILSRKDYLQILKEEERKKVLAQLKPGAVMECKVIRVTNLYADVDFGGGIRGKILRDDVDWNRVESCRDKLVRGQEIKVKIIETEPFIRASIKHLTRDPWLLASEKYKVGDVIEGEISDIKDFGAFIKVDVGGAFIEALLPFSEAGWNKAEAKKKFNVGDKVSAVIINFAPEQRKLTLSLKKILPNPYDILRNEPNKVRRAIVRSEVSRGYIVELYIEEAETHIKAFLPKSEISWFLNDTISLKEGDEIDVKTIFVRWDDVVVSKKKVEEDVMKNIYEDIKGREFEARVILAPDKKDRGLWVSFNVDGKIIKGFIPLSELVSKIINYSKDEIVKCQVIDYDSRLDTIILSENKAMLDEASGNKVTVTLGSLLENITKNKK